MSAEAATAYPRPAPAPEASARLFLLVVLFFVPYAAWFIWNTSFVIEGTRYFCLFDDAMISMTYARNAALGHGWVWNAGEVPIEGYTNPLWTLYMTGIHLLPVAASKLSLVVQLTALLCLCANLWFVQRLAGRLTSGSRGFVLAAMALTAFYYPLDLWSLQGMEVGPLALLVSALVWYAVRSLDEQRFFARIYVLSAAGVLTRMDMLVPCAVVWLFLAWQQRAWRARHLLAGLASLFGSLLLLTLWRWWTYGDLLPNTYYLKMQGYPALARIATGLISYAMLVHQQNVLLFLLPFAVLLLQPQRSALLLAAVFLAQSAYSVYVGGDAWEWFGGANRYVSIVMPLFLVLLCAAGWELWRRLEPTFRPALARLPLAGRGGPALGALVFLVVLLSLNLSSSLRSLGRVVFLEPPLHVVGHRDMVDFALFLKRITRPDARVAVVWAGIVPYFAERPMIDMLGKNDRYVAHLPMHGSEAPGLGSFYPGHLKWDYAHSIDRLGADVVVRLWRSPEQAAPFLEANFEKHQRHGADYYLRAGSPRIDWDRVAEIERESDAG